MTEFAKASLRINEPPAPTRKNTVTIRDRLPPTQRPSNQSVLRTLSQHDAAITLRREPAHDANQNTALLDNLTGRAIDEIKHEKSYKVLVTIALVARKNHLLKPLADALNSIVLSNGTYLDAFVQTLLVEGGEGIHNIVVELLAKEGVHREDSPQVMAMSFEERLWAAAFMGVPEIPAELLHQIVGALPWIAALWAASHAIVLGGIVDLLGIAFLGQAANQLVNDLLDFYSLAKNARNESDLRAAGRHLASVFAMIGIVGLGKIAKKYGSSVKQSARQLGRRVLPTVLAAALKGTADAAPALALDAAPKVNISAAETRAPAPQSFEPTRPLQSVQPEPASSPANTSSADDLNLDHAFEEYNGSQTDPANASVAPETTAVPTPAEPTARTPVDRSPSAIADRGSAAGLTRAQAQAAKEAMTNLTAGRGLLGRIWERVTNPGEPATLTEANSRRLFNNQRRRFWSAVFDEPEARALFERIGAIFGKRGRAPVLRLPTGETLQMTVDHIIERQTDPTRALDQSNLRISPRLENTVLLRLIHYYDAFQHPPR